MSGKEGEMPFHRLIEESAKALNTTPETLREFEESGWISTIERNGNRYLAGKEEYKVRFILSLRRRLRLSKQQISKVLREQAPPYSFEEASRMLVQAGQAEEPRTGR
jgi:DNA-binding transcriptional MerR regulator